MYMNGLTLQDEKRALFLSNLAYQKDKPGDEVICIKAKNEKAIVIIHDTYVEIALAGSDDKWDWIDNLRIIGKSTKIYGRIMGGFYTNLNRLLPKIEEIIKDHKDKEIRLAGHSRGASIMLLLVIALRRKGYRISVTEGWAIGFGCPNTGKKSFVKIYKATGCRTILVKNGGDQVTRNPRFGYKKPVKQKKIGPKRNWFTAIFNKDHLIERYFKSYGL